MGRLSGVEHVDLHQLVIRGTRADARSPEADVGLIPIKDRRHCDAESGERWDNENH
jgi:hypothetical protein